MAEKVTMDEARSIAGHAEVVTYISRRSAQRIRDALAGVIAELDELRAAAEVIATPDARYVDGDLVVPLGSHGAALAAMRRLRAALGTQ